MHHVEFLTDSSIPDIIMIHRASLPEDVLPALGTSFLSDYYRLVFSNGFQSLFGCYINKKLVGFCQLSLKPIGLIQIAFRPRNILRIIALAFSNTRLFLSGILQILNSKSAQSRVAEIAFIAVLPEFQGKGIGSALINFANMHARDHEMGKVCTKTSNPLMKGIYLSKYSAEVTSSFKIMGKEYFLLDWPVYSK